MYQLIFQLLRLINHWFKRESEPVLLSYETENGSISMIPNTYKLSSHEY